MNAVSGGTTQNYESLLNDAASAVPNMNVSLMTSIRTFLKAKPKPLGIVLIDVAVLQIGLGIGLVFMVQTIAFPSGLFFWALVIYITAGPLTVAAQCNPNICLVKGSLYLNITSSIFSSVALILNFINLATIWNYEYYYYNNETYHYICNRQIIGGYVAYSLLLMINLVLFCVSLSVSIFGCRSLSQVTPNVPQVFVIQNDAVVSMNPSTVPAMMSPLFAPPAPALNIVQQVTAKQ
ncbi:membrane-spanning 4-domains subfamily A member 4A-like [Mixophyes fleayi]|uniref:membrane-spanning 4-domains subfamily A member 4A-like n=1 Tax=Mixophyes fleayi TaxID=3061075 RepID=UPI003F4DA32D